MPDSRSLFVACVLSPLLLCGVSVGACSPCAIIRTDLDRALREEAALVGVGTRVDSGWQPHAELVVGHDLLQRLVPVLDSGAALPEVRIDSQSDELSWVFRATPQLASLAVVSDENGQPALRLRFVAGDGTTVRLRGTPGALTAVAEAIAVVPIVAVIERPVQVDADFGQARVVEASAAVEFGLGDAITESLSALWAAELERILQIDVGPVELFQIQAAVGLEPRIVGVDLGQNDSLALLLVTALRPRGVDAPRAEAIAPSSSLRLHPGMLEAWIRERTADNAGRRTLDRAGNLDASAANVVTVRSIRSEASGIALDATLWCVEAPRCSVSEVAATGTQTFGRSGISFSFEANDQAGGWLQLVGTEASSLLNGFAILMPGAPLVRLLPRTTDESGRLLMRVQLPEGAY